MLLRQAAQQALEALNHLYNDVEIMVTYEQHRATKGAITALRAALAEPEQIGYARCPRCWEPITAPTPRKPLTDEEIDKFPWGPHEGNPMTFAEGLRDFARAIERAHGIGEQT